jgi:hypothetical protein
LVSGLVISVHSCFLKPQEHVQSGFDLNLDAALKILKAAGHQIGDAHIPPAPHGDAMRIWIDGVPCTLRGVLRMAEEVIEAKDEEKPEQPT